MQDKELQNTYRQQLPGLSAELKKAAYVWEKKPCKETFDLFFTKVLDISGTAEMFGQHAIGLIAKSLQAEMSPFFHAKDSLNTHSSKHILAINDQLVSMMQSPERVQNKDIREVFFKSKISYKESLHIILLEDDIQLAEDIQYKLSSTNFNISVIASTSEIKTYFQPNTSCIIADLDNLNASQLETLGKLEEVKSSLPLIFMSTDSSIHKRLEAVQAGGQAFIVKPVDYSLLLQAIDSLTERVLSQNYRVLIVEDQKSLSDYYASILENAEFEVMPVNHPETDLMPSLIDFIPDLILLDLYMPFCNGQELAGIIRQMDNLLSVPIVFLSAEDSSDLQLRAMSTGADAFLTKPVSPDDLLLTVQSRIKRGRAVRDLVTKDPLSGLLNRRESMRRLDEEISRYRRNNSPLSVAILDLDNFKKINDSLGHAIGDWVIKFFARSMQKIFRESDIIGRQGGEEFVVIFPDVDTSSAQLACDRLKKHIKENAPSLPTAFTFSGGLALVEASDNSTSILERADQALYKAKEKGRNKVITATNISH